MTYMFEVTTVKTPRVRIPKPEPKLGIYSAADIGISKGHSKDLFVTLENMLAEQWKNLNKSEKVKRALPSSPAAPTLGERGANRKTMTQAVFDVVEGRKRFTASDIMGDVEFTPKQVRDALAGLQRAKVVECVGRTDDRNPQTIFSHISGAKLQKPGRKWADISTKVEAVRQYVEKNAPAVRNTMMADLDITKGQAQAALSSLRDKGIIVSTYSKEHKTYVWNIVEEAS